MTATSTHATAAAIVKDLADTLSTLTDPDEAVRAAAAGSLVRRHLETSARYCEAVADDSRHRGQKGWYLDQAALMRSLAVDVASEGVDPARAMAAFHTEVTP